MKSYVAPKITKLTQLAKSKKEVLAQGKVFRQLKNTKANLNIKARNFIDTIKKGSANKSLTRTETNTLITEILENPGQTAEILQKRGILKSLSEEEVQMCKRFQLECKAKNKFLTPQEMNEFKAKILEGKDVIFQTKDQAVDFVKKKFPRFPEETAGNRSAEGWHFDKHTVKNVENVEHINIYSKEPKFRVHITWSE